MNPAILHMTQKGIDRFWSHVDIRGAHECWPWLASRRKGYGSFSLGRKDDNIQSNQVAAFLFLGPPEPLDLYALHTCDYRPCCNGFHLFWGTNQDNQLDASRKGIFKERGGHPGTSNGRAKLTDSQVIEIKNSSDTCKALAAVYKVSISLVGQIKHGDVWKHL